MQELLELILKNITTYPDEVSLEKSVEDGREIYTIKVHPDDMGRVIGKNGKVIQAIRSLAHVISIRQNKRFRINLADSGNQTAAPTDDANDQPSDDTPTTPPEPAKADTDIDLLSGAIALDDMKPETDTADDTSPEPAKADAKTPKTKK